MKKQLAMQNVYSIWYIHGTFCCVNIVLYPCIIFVSIYVWLFWTDCVNNIGNLLLWYL